MTGLDVGAVRSLDGPQARAEVIKDFNNPDGEIKLVFANIHTLEYGVILHHDCPISVTLGTHSSARPMWQIFYRLVRKGQHGEQMTNALHRAHTGLPASTPTTHLAEEDQKLREDNAHVKATYNALPILQCGQITPNPSP